MGIRSVNNIRVVRNAPQTIEQAIKTRQPLNNPLFGFNIDTNNLFLTDLSLYEKKLGRQEAFIKLSKKDLKFYKNLCKETEKYLCKECPSVIEFIFSAGDVLRTFENSYSINNPIFKSHIFEVLSPKLINMGLFAEQNNLYSLTPSGHNFLKIFRDLDYSLPFNWDYLVDDTFNFDLNDYYAYDEKMIKFNDDHAKYILGLEHWDDNYNENNLDKNYKHTSMYLIVDLEVQIPDSTDVVEDINEVYSDSPQDKKALNKIVKDISRSIKRSNTEMIPISSNYNSSILQGTVDNKPIFAEIDNDVLKYCRNLYGDGLKIVADGLDQNNVDDEEIRICIVKNNKVVMGLTAPYYFGSEDTVTNTRTNLLAYNFNILRNV